MLVQPVGMLCATNLPSLPSLDLPSRDQEFPASFSATELDQSEGTVTLPIPYCHMTRAQLGVGRRQGRHLPWLAEIQAVQG